MGRPINYFAKKPAQTAQRDERAAPPPTLAELTGPGVEGGGEEGLQF